MTEKKPGCCEQGGCCNHTPRREIHDAGSLVRLNLAISKCQCCRCCSYGLDVTGLDPSDFERLPIELVGKTTLDFTDWQVGIQQLAAVQGENTCSFSRCMTGCSLVVAWISVIGICWACSQFGKMTLARDKKLREWQVEFNKVLSRHNMMIKTRSFCFVTYNDKGQRQRHVSRWLALAVTAEECIVLQNEPHLTGVVDNTKCCNGVDEKELCWHHG